MVRVDFADKIRAALTPELLKEPYRSKVLRGECSPLTGHCYVASEAYFHAHGGKAAGLKPMSIQHEGGPHWWIRDAQGRDIDLTAEQFATPVPYEKGVGKGFLTKTPSKRAAVVMARAQAQANPARGVRTARANPTSRDIAIRYPAGTHLRLYTRTGSIGVWVTDGSLLRALDVPHTPVGSTFREWLNFVWIRRGNSLPFDMTSFITRAEIIKENSVTRTNPKRRTTLPWKKPDLLGWVRAHTKAYSYGISPREARGYEVRQAHVHDYDAHIVTLGWVKTLAGAKALAEKAYTKRLRQRAGETGEWGTRMEREYHEQHGRQERAYREDTRWNPSLGQVWAGVKRAVQGPPSPYVVGDRVRLRASGTAPGEKATWGHVRRLRRGESADGWQVYVEWPAAYGPAGWERGDDVTRLPPKGPLRPPRPRSNPAFSAQMRAASSEPAAMIEHLKPGDPVEFKSPSDFRGWISGTFESDHNNEHGLWLVVKRGRIEYEVPHPWVRLPRPRSNPAPAHRIDTAARDDRRTGKRAEAQAALRRIAKANEMGFYLDHRGWYQQGIDANLVETLSRGRGAMRKASAHRDYLSPSDAARLNAFVAGTGRL